MMQDTLPFVPWSATSKAAADSAKPSRSITRDAVLAFIMLRGAHGATDEEIQEGSRLNPSTQRPRRIELERAGLIKKAGFSRKTRAGRQAEVYVAA